jgi:hypothetical protein
VNGAHLAGRLDHVVLHIVAIPTPNCLRHGFEHDRLILRVDPVQNLLQGADGVLGPQPKDPVGFRRPSQELRLEVAIPIADVGEALGFFQFRLALSQSAKQ